MTGRGGGRTQPGVQTLGLGILSSVITPLSVINYQSGETKNSPPSPTSFVAKLLISAHHKEQYESIADISSAVLLTSSSSPHSQLYFCKLQSYLNSCLLDCKMMLVVV